MEEPVVIMQQPRGQAGVQHSLEAVAEKVSKGRLHPRVRAWTTKVLEAAGYPKGPVARAEAILYGVRSITAWVPDPVNAEFIGGAHLMVPDENGERMFAAGDCDDLSVLYLAAVTSVGTRARVVGHGYDKGGQNITHVLGGIWDPQAKMWLHADPSLPDMPFGQSKPWTSEHHLALPSGLTVCKASVCPHTPPNEMEEGGGEYVGVGHVIESLGDDSLVQDLTARIQDLRDSLDAGWKQFALSYDAVKDVSAILNKSLADIGWSDADEQTAQGLAHARDIAMEGLDQALAGIRSVGEGAVDGKKDFVIEALKSDTFGLSIANGVLQTIKLDTSSVVNILKEGPDGEQFKVGDDEYITSVSAENGTLGIIHLIATPAAILLGLWAVYALIDLIDKAHGHAVEIARSHTDDLWLACVDSAKCTPEQLLKYKALQEKIDQSKVDLQDANNKGNPGAQVASVLDRVIIIAGGAAALWGAYKIYEDLRGKKG